MGVLHSWHISLGHPEIEEEQVFFAGIFSINSASGVMAFAGLCRCCWDRGEEKKMGKEKGVAMSRT